MSKIKQDYSNNEWKSDNYSVKSLRKKVYEFIGLLLVSSIWGAIAVQVIIESTK